MQSADYGQSSTGSWASTSEKRMRTIEVKRITAYLLILISIPLFVFNLYYSMYINAFNVLFIIIPLNMLSIWHANILEKEFFETFT